MSLLNRLTKGVGDAADRAKFEADKALRVRKMTSEVGKLEADLQRAIVALGERAMELRPEGLEELVDQADGLKLQVAAKREELTTVKAEEFVEPEVSAKFCASCGTELEEGTKFCPSCGTKA